MTYPNLLPRHVLNKISGQRKLYSHAQFFCSHGHSCTPTNSLLALVLGVFGALHFSSFTASLLANYIEWDYLPLLAFALTFIGIMIGVAWIGKLLTKLAKVVLLGFLNRLLGALFGACKWLVICGVLLWIVGQLDVFFSFLPESLKEDSLVFQPLEELGDYLFEKINTENNLSNKFLK